MSGTPAGLVFRDLCVPIFCRLCVLGYPILLACPPHPHPPEVPPCPGSAGAQARAARISWALRIIGFSPCLASKESDELLPSPAPRSGLRGSVPLHLPLLSQPGGRALKHLPPCCPTHHLIIGIPAEPGGQLDGPHKDEEEPQGHREGDDGDGPGRCHGPSEALWLWLPARVGGSPSPLKAGGIKLQRQEEDSGRGSSLLHSATPGS